MSHNTLIVYSIYVTCALIFFHHGDVPSSHLPFTMYADGRGRIKNWRANLYKNTSRFAITAKREEANEKRREEKWIGDKIRTRNEKNETGVEEKRERGRRAGRGRMRVGRE